MQVTDTVLRQGAALFSVDPESLQSLGGSDGAVYAGETSILKFVPIQPDAPPKALDVVREKWDFASYLAENGVPAAQPLRSRHGALIETLSEAGATWVVTLSKRVPGRHIDWQTIGENSDAIIEAWGRLLGRMQALAKNYAGGAHLPGGIDEARGFTRWSETACRDEAITQKWREMEATLTLLPMDRDAYGLAHNDLHPGNFLVDTGPDGKPGLTVIDFDVCHHHWFFIDLAIALFPAAVGWMHSTQPGETREMFVRRFWQRFMAGYTQENALGNEWLERIPLGLKYRQLLLYVVFNAEWQHPNEQQQEMLRAWRRAIVNDTPVSECAFWQSQID
jgi:Ser/Thr protein kinase RdoA (MazF antagonist)